MSNIKYSFVIDTNMYAGNFEREMCAFLTAIVGECTVGDKIISALDLNTEIKYWDQLSDLVRLEPDEHGCCRPVTISTTPGWSNDGYGNSYNDTQHKYPSYQSVKIHLEAKPSDDIVKFLKNRGNIFVEFNKANPNLFMSRNLSGLKILGYRLEKEEIIVTSEDL